jgi:peptide/nickel transport system substrate-binding protein
VAEDGLTYTFRLRDGVVFHDIPPVNGRELRAADVVSTMNRIKDGGIAAYMLSNVERIEAPDDRTVVFRLSAPFAPLLNYLASYYMWILPEEANTGVYDPSVTVIGTGPFILEERQPNVSMTYRANPDYYGEGPYIDGLRRMVVPDQGAKIAAFRAGEADVIPGPSPEQTDQVLSTTPGAQELTLLSPTHVALYMNQRRPPLDDARVRQAMSLAIDREGLGTSVFGGGIYSGPVVGSLGKWALDQEELAELYRYDPDRARELLTEAGVEDLRLTINASAGYGEQVIRANQWVAQDLAEVGITAEIQMMDYGAQIASLSGQFDITVNPQTPYVEADEWLRAQLYRDMPRNRFGVDDPELNRMLEEQLTILDEDERVEAVHDIQRYVAEHMLGFIPLWDNVNTTLVSGRVRDYFPDPLYGSYEYRLIWLDQEG